MFKKGMNGVKALKDKVATGHDKGGQDLAEQDSTQEQESSKNRFKGFAAKASSMVKDSLPERNSGDDSDEKLSTDLVNEETSESRLKGVISKAGRVISECAAKTADSIVAGTNQAKDATSRTLDVCAAGIQAKAHDLRCYSVEKNDVMLNTMKSMSQSIKEQKVFDKDFYSELIESTMSFSKKRISDAFERTFELNKDSEEIVSELKSKQPPTPQSIDDIFADSKKETIQRAISAFGLSAAMSSFDEDMAARYSNLSKSYTDFGNEVNLHDAQNFKDMQAERAAARESGSSLEDGYHKSQELDPFMTDIEHVIAKKTWFENLFIRAATTDKELVQAMNAEENLVFTLSSVNRSKNSEDFREYLEQHGVPDPTDPEKIILEIKGKEYVVNKEDCLEAYDTAQESYHEAQIEALQDLGISVVDSSTRMAIQQVVGLFIVETGDIFIEEVQSLVKSGALNQDKSIREGLSERCVALNEKFSKRLEERGIFERARSLGLESMLSGAISMMPMALIALFVELPGFVFTILRECFLSVLRAARVLLSEAKDKLKSIQTILFGTVSAVLGVYISQLIATVIAGIPGVNMFTMEVSAVLSTAILTVLILVTLYQLENRKNDLKTAVCDDQEGVLDPT